MNLQWSIANDSDIVLLFNIAMHDPTIWCDRHEVRLTYNDINMDIGYLYIAAVRSLRGSVD